MISQVLEACVKNCGHRFHVLVSTRDFVEVVLVRTILPRNDPPLVIHDRILSIIQVRISTIWMVDYDDYYYYATVSYGAIMLLYKQHFNVLVLHYIYLIRIGSVGTVSMLMSSTAALVHVQYGLMTVVPDSCVYSSHHSLSVFRPGLMHFVALRI